MKPKIRLRILAISLVAGAVFGAVFPHCVDQVVVFINSEFAASAEISVKRNCHLS